MSIREINDQYKEYADPYEPVKGKKSHDGIIISQKKRMQQAAKGASVSIAALGILSLIVLNLFFHLSAEIIHHSATAHEATVSFVVDTSDFDQAGVYYILTDPDGNPVATAPVNAADNTAYFEQLEENTDYLFTLYDKNGNPLQSQIVTTADDPSPIPEILSLTAAYDRTTETVTIHGEIQTNDAENFNAELSASDFPMNPDAVSLWETDGIAHITYSHGHPLTMGEYGVKLLVSYTDEGTPKEKDKTATFKSADLIINGFDGSVNANKVISLNAIAVHHHTDSEPYEIRAVTITGKQIYSGKTFDVPASFLVNGDQITVKAATEPQKSGKYRFSLSIDYTVNGTDAPIFTATTDSIDIMVPYPIPAVTPKPTAVPTPTPTPTPVPPVVTTPIPTPTYTDLEIDEPATSANWDMDIYVYSAAIINDAENITGTVSFPALGLDAPLTLTDNGDGTLDAAAVVPGGSVPPGRHEAIIRYDYTLNGQAAFKTTSRSVEAGAIIITDVYRSGSSDTMTADTSVSYEYIGPDGPYTIDAIRAELYSSAQSLVTSAAGTPPALDPSHSYYDSAFFDSLTDTVYYIQWVIDYTIGSGSSAYSATATSALFRVDLINPSIATMPPSAQYSVSRTGSGAAMAFQFFGNGGIEISGVHVYINGIDAATAGYTVTNNITNAEGTLIVSGPFSELTEVFVEYTYLLSNSDVVGSTSTSGHLDIGYFTGLELSGITVTPNGDGTANVTGTITTANTAPVSIDNVIAKVVGADATEYPGNIDASPDFDSGTNTGTFTITGITLPPSGDYTVAVEATGYPNHSYPYSITIHGSASVTQTVTP